MTTSPISRHRPPPSAGQLPACPIADCRGPVVRHSLGCGMAVYRCTRCYRAYEGPGESDRKRRERRERRLGRLLREFASWTEVD